MSEITHEENSGDDRTSAMINDLLRFSRVGRNIERPLVLTVLAIDIVIVDLDPNF